MKSPSVKVLAITAGVAAAVFLVAVLLARAPITGVEHSAFTVVFELPDELAPVFKAVTYIGTLGLLLAVAVVALARRQWLRAALIVPLVVVAYGLTYLVKETLVSRPRPPVLFDVVPREEFDVIARDGFPSGHVAVAMVLAIWLVLLLSATWRWVLPAVPVVVGLGRVYIGEHLPLDIVGGLALGVFVAFAAHLAVALVRRRSSQPSDPVDAEG